MKTRIILTAAFVALFALPGVLGAQAADPLTIANAWNDALNAGDIDGALAYLADEAVLTFIPPTPGTSGVLTGKGEIRAWYEAVVAAHGVGTLSDCQVDGETLTCTDTYTDDDFAAMGVGSIVGEWVAVVRDGKIQSYTFTMSAESLAKLGPPPGALPATGGPGMAALLPLWVGIGGALIGLGGLGLRRVRSR